MESPNTEQGQIAKYGAKVFVKELIGDDFVTPNSRKAGVYGYIVGHSNSHGLCFGVMHNDDGEVAWYNPDELTELGPDPDWIEMWQGMSPWYQAQCLSLASKSSRKDGMMCLVHIGRKLAVDAAIESFKKKKGIK